METRKKNLSIILNSNAYERVLNFLPPVELITLLETNKNFRLKTFEFDLTKPILNLLKNLKKLNANFLINNYMSVFLGIINYLKSQILLKFQYEISSFYNISFSILSSLFSSQKINCLKLNKFNNSLISNHNKFFRNLIWFSGLSDIRISDLTLNLNSTVCFSDFLKRNKISSFSMKLVKLKSENLLNIIVDALSYDSNIEIFKLKEMNIFGSNHDFLQRLLTETKSLKKLVLKNNNIEDSKGFNTLILSQLKMLTKLTLENVDVDENIFNDALSLIISSKLTDLKIKLSNSKANCDNLFFLLSSYSNLELLDISKCSLAYTYLKYLIQKIQTLKNEKLKILNLGRIYLTNDCKESFINFCKSNRCITSFSFNDSFTEINKEIYLEALLKSNHFTSLNLNRSTIISSNFDFLKYFFLNKNIQHLSLKECNITVENFYYFSLAFFDMKSLRYLDLSSNRLTVSCASHICEALISTKSLEYFDLSNNWLGISSLVPILISLIHNNSIKTFLYRNNFFDVDIIDGFENDVTSFKFPVDCKGNCRIDNSCKNAILEKIDLGKNFVNEKCMSIVEYYTKPFQNLKTLKLDEIYVSDRYINSTKFVSEFRLVYSIAEGPNQNDFKLNNYKIPFELILKIFDIFQNRIQLNFKLEL